MWEVEVGEGEGVGVDDAVTHTLRSALVRPLRARLRDGRLVHRLPRFVVPCGSYFAASAAFTSASLVTAPT